MNNLCSNKRPRYFTQEDFEEGFAVYQIKRKKMEIKNDNKNMVEKLNLNDIDYKNINPSKINDNFMSTKLNCNMLNKKLFLVPQFYPSKIPNFIPKKDFDVKIKNYLLKYNQKFDQLYDNILKKFRGKDSPKDINLYALYNSHRLIQSTYIDDYNYDSKAEDEDEEQYDESDSNNENNANNSYPDESNDDNTYDNQCDDNYSNEEVDEYDEYNNIYYNDNNNDYYSSKYGNNN